MSTPVLARSDSAVLPEHAAEMKTYIIDRGCKLCDACFWACPAKAIYIENDRASIDQGKCIRCGVCYNNCPNEAITVIEETSANQQQHRTHLNRERK